MNWLRELWAGLRTLPRETWNYWRPDAIAERMNRWVMNLHRPIPVDEDTALCNWCNTTEWPCKHWSDAERRLQIMRGDWP